MNRIEEANRFAYNYAKELNNNESYEAYAEQEDIANACLAAIKWADEHPRQGLWDSEKVITWIALHAELYGGFNHGKLNSMCEDLQKAMEESQ